MSEDLLLCLYLIHKGHLKHQENNEHLLVLLDHFVTDAFDQRYNYENLPRTSFNKKQFVFLLFACSSTSSWYCLVLSFNISQ